MSNGDPPIEIPDQAAYEGRCQEARLLLADEIKALLDQRYEDGLRAFAWWKDGVQYVGSCGTTLEKALEDAKGD